MKFSVVTLFPEIIRGFFQDSIMARCVEKGSVEYELVQIRDYAYDRHRTCDDAPYGGGAGMILKPEPLGRALEAVDGKHKRVVFPTPTGKRFTQEYAQELAGEQELVIVCGRYEGIDQRIIDLYVDDEISIGDYVISSGEIAALVIIDAVYRLLDGVISQQSLVEESFSDGLLEYPQYTRPAEYCGISVPDVLLSGHHAQVEQWRLVERVRKTLKNRPDLSDQVREDPKLQQLIDRLQTEETLSEGE